MQLEVGKKMRRGVGNGHDEAGVEKTGLKRDVNQLRPTGVESPEWGIISFQMTAPANITMQKVLTAEHG